MKWLALVLLLGAAVLYGLSSAWSSHHPAWGYVAAFAEAAMVGAVADWFAVVALFRRPFGLPIPHTAIIPSNKDRLGENLARFICANFLSTEQVLVKLRNLDLPSRLAAWLAQDSKAASLAAHLGGVIRHVLAALDDEAARHFFRQLMVDRLQQFDAPKLAGQLLNMLTAQGRHEELLDDVLRWMARVLDDDSLKDLLADVVTAEVKYLRFVGLDAVAGRYATRKLVAGVVKLLSDMGEDASHPLRQRFNHFMTEFAVRLKEEPALRARGQALLHDLLEHPQLAHYLHELWDELLGWLGRDLAQADSHLRERVTRIIQGLGEQLTQDTAMQDWLRDQVMAAAPRLIERYREDIRLYIVGRVHEWNAQEMTDELERNVGRDLQFIRINGTLVGGLVGLAIHVLTELMRTA